ncbi:MAG: hypothetical protein ABL309_12175 [Phycisphaerales bacterium]
MQRTTRNLPARLHRGRVLSAAVLTASALLLATAPQAAAQDGVWAHYDVTEPKVITLEFDTDLLAFDLCWSDHTDMVKEQIVNGAIAQMNDPTQLHVIRMPGLPPFYRRTSNAPVWHDLTGGVITSSDVLPNRASYHIDVEQALIEIAGRIRAERPGAKLAFEGFELQPLPGRPPAYEELGALQDFYITDRTIYLNHVGHILHHALNSTFYRARVDFAEAQDNWLVFPNQTGQFSLASLDNPAWPPEEIEPEIMALWGGDGDEGGGDGGGGGGGGGGGDHGELPALLPGSGWSGPTEQPAPIGSPSADGYDATSIARWDVVPQQVIDGPFPIGVIAFHMNEIDRVEFSADNGPWVSVDEMVYNPRTEVWEYTVLFDPEAFVDGEVEVRAIAYPEVGTPRVLEPLTLYANAGGTIPSTEIFVSMTGSDESGDGTRENPYKTIWRGIKSVGSVLDNVTVFLEPGVYEYTGTSYPQPSAGIGWTTITAAPGVNRNDVQIVAGERRIRVNRIKLDNLTLDQSDGWQITGYSTMNWDFWINRVVGQGQDQLTGSPYGSVFQNIYVTDSHFSDYRDGTMGAAIARNVSLERLGSDAFHNSRMVVNSTVDIIDRLDSDYHPDVFQIYGPSRDVENVILYNVRASRVQAQGIFVSGVNSLRDMAVINVSIDKEGSGAWTNQIAAVPVNHLVIRHASIPNMTWGWRSDDIRNVSVVASVWRKVISMPFNGNTPVIEDEWFHENHYIAHNEHGAMLLGTNYTLGDPMFEEPTPGEFRPLAGSPLKGRLGRLLPADMAGFSRDTLSSLGALE